VGYTGGPQHVGHVAFFGKVMRSAREMLNNTGEWEIFGERVRTVRVDYSHSPAVYSFGSSAPIQPIRYEMMITLELSGGGQVEMMMCDKHDALSLPGLNCSCYQGSEYRHTPGYRPVTYFPGGYVRSGPAPKQLTTTAPKPPPEQLTGAIRMWRMWYLTDTDELRALNTTHVWVKGENISHEIPQKKSGSHCGFYGFNSWDHFIDQEKDRLNDWYMGVQDQLKGHSYYIPRDALPVVLGSFLGYGKCVVASMGARVEKAVPEYLVLSPNDDYSIRLLTVAEKYGMTPISLDEVKTLKTGLVPYERVMKKPESKGDWLL
jgi:hypothetical protein